MMLELHNVMIKPSNVRKKVREPLNVTKKIITCDVETTQCDDGTIECEKKVREPPNVTKKLTITCEVGTVQCEDETVKCEKKKKK